MPYARSYKHLQDHFVSLLKSRTMDELSRQLFAVALAATWCGFGLFGLARMAARSPQGREMLERLRRSGPLGEAAALALLVAVPSRRRERTP